MFARWRSRDCRKDAAGNTNDGDEDVDVLVVGDQPEHTEGNNNNSIICRPNKVFIVVVILFLVVLFLPQVLPLPLLLFLSHSFLLINTMVI